jgi:hypothetical protein
MSRAAHPTNILCGLTDTQTSPITATFPRTPLVLTDPKVQQRIVVALDGAEKDLNEGLSNLPTWKLVEEIATALSNAPRAAARAAVTAAEGALAAVEHFQKQQADSKFRLKAAGAHWHNESLTGPIENCPLCEASLKDNLVLQGELDELRSAGEAATRSLEDNVNAIMTTLAETPCGRARSALRRRRGPPLAGLHRRACDPTRNRADIRAGSGGTRRSAALRCRTTGRNLRCVAADPNPRG